MSTAHFIWCSADTVFVNLNNSKSIEHVRQAALLLDKENQKLTRENARLKEENRFLKGDTSEQKQQDLVGVEDERRSTSKEDEKSKEARTSPKTASERRNGREKETSTSGEPQRGHGPTEQPNLPIVEKTYDLDEADRVCPECGDDFNRWSAGDDTNDIISIIPAQFICTRQTKKAYRCKCGTLEKADAPRPLRKGGRYDISIAIQAAVDKFQFHLPMERQAQRASMVGMCIRSQTIWDQLYALALFLKPTVERIRQSIVLNDLAGMDLTTMPLLLKGETLFRQVWQMASPDARYLEICAGKHSSYGRRLLTLNPKDGDNGPLLAKQFSGILMTDGALELCKLGASNGVRLANCMSHARRQIIKAGSEYPDKRDAALDFIGELYAIEKEALIPDATASPRAFRAPVDVEKLAHLRNTKSRAVMEKFKKWLTAQRVDAGGNFIKAMRYISTRWTALTRFLDDARIPLDTNFVERGFVPTAIGRRNYIGCRSERGLFVVGIFYSLLGSAAICGKSEAAYLDYAARVAFDGGMPLLPVEWLPS